MASANKRPVRTRGYYLALLVSSASLAALLSWPEGARGANEQPLRPWIRSRPSTRAPQAGSTATPASTGTGTGSAVEVALPASGAAANRTIRTADVFQNGEGYNIFVTNTCERESMKVNIRTSREFYGIIHTRNQRQKPICRVEGTGKTEYNLEISHVLNPQDPSYCGVIRARRESPDDQDTLSLVVAVRVHRNIELPDDKFFLLNCTNRCRKPDCSNPSARLVDDPSRTSEVESIEPEGREPTGSGPGGSAANRTSTGEDECTIWKLPWAVTLLTCLGILTLFLLISNCIMCSTMVCRCVKTEVEEKEPSVYEGATTDCDEDGLYNKRHPYRIDYDNREIYTTSNNYAPYTLEEAQAKSRRKHRREGSR